MPPEQRPLRAVKIFGTALMGDCGEMVSLIITTDFINTRLQPGDREIQKRLTVSTVFTPTKKPLKRFRSSPERMTPS